MQKEENGTQPIQTVRESVVLAPGRSAVQGGKKHLDPSAVWLFFLKYLLIIIIVSFFFWPFTLFFIIGGTAVFLQNPLFGIMFLTVGLLLLLVPVGLAYLLARLSYSNWIYEIRSEEIRIEKGIIWKRYISIPYARIQNVDILRGIFSRLLGLSDLQIQTAGFSGRGHNVEGKLPGLSIKEAEIIRDWLVKKAQQ